MTQSNRIVSVNSESTWLKVNALMLQGFEFQANIWTGNIYEIELTKQRVLRVVASHLPFSCLQNRNNGRNTAYAAASAD